MKRVCLTTVVIVMLLSPCFLSGENVRNQVDSPIERYAQQEQVVFSGNIVNKAKRDFFDIYSPKGHFKRVTIDAKGNFHEVLNLVESEPNYSIKYGENSISLFLKKGDSLHLSFDTQNFGKTINFEGKGAVNNNFLASKQQIVWRFDTPEVYELKQKDFEKKLLAVYLKYEYLVNQATDLDPSILSEEKEFMKSMRSFFMFQYDMMNKHK